MEAHGYRHTGELVEAINSGAYEATEEDIEALLLAGSMQEESP